MARPEWLLFGPELISDVSDGGEFIIEFSFHSCPPQIKKNLLHLFVDKKKILEETSIVIIPTFQPTHEDLMDVGPKVQEEKDKKLEQVTLGH